MCFLTPDIVNTVRAEMNKEYEDKKKELVKFLASLSTEIRKIIKPNEILKKILKSIGKDRIIALFNNKKLQEIDKILANNQIDKNINFKEILKQN